VKTDFVNFDISKLTEDEQVEYLELLEEKYKQDAIESLIDFTQFTYEAYDTQWFHRLACFWVDKLLKREIKKLMIFIPPQHGKTEISSRRFPAFALGRNPEEKIILGSYNLTKASEFLIDAARIIKGEKYKELFPETIMNGKDTATFFEVNGGTGFMKAFGPGSGITGTTATIGIWDDPFKGRNEANSQTTRDSTWNSYQDDFLTRLNNDSVILLLFTRWHEDDLAGRILDPKNPHYDEEEASEWTVIALPALKEATKPIACAMDIEDPRELDEALWESKHSKAKYVKRRRINPKGFTSLDQQRPAAEEGNKIRKEWFNIIKESELPFSLETAKVNFVIDGAFTEKTENDESSLMAYVMHEEQMYILNCHGIRKELYELLPYFRTYAIQHHHSKKSNVWIELKASGHPLKSMLSKMQYGGFNTREIPNKWVGLGKFNRVENSEAVLASGKVHLVQGSWNHPFIDQCAAFPNGIHDDMVDDLTYAVHLEFIKPQRRGVKRSS